LSLPTRAHTHALKHSQNPQKLTAGAAPVGTSVSIAPPDPPSAAAAAAAEGAACGQRERRDQSAAQDGQV